MQKKFIRYVVGIVREGKQALILLNGGPGSGKTFGTKKLMKALRLFQIQTVCTGTTGTAALSFEGGMTLHHLVKIGITPLPPKSVHAIYSRKGPKSRRGKVLDNLNGAGALVIDEISFSEGEVFGSADAVLRTVRGVNLPFGGLTTILVGDFDQKKPCKKGSSLAQILVNYTTEDVQNTERARIAGVFQQFRKFELTGSERIKNKDDELHQILHHIKMNDPPITLELLERLPKLKRLDEMTNAEREKWRFCPVMCTSNETRN